MTKPAGPSFTVVIPVHNKAPHVRRAITSVLTQTVRDFELLLVDDASTDASLTEMRTFIDPRISILQRQVPGPGGYAARNLGVTQATAEWVAFLDADDAWQPEHLQELQRLIVSFPDAGLVCTSWLEIETSQRGEANPFHRYAGGETARQIDFLEFLEVSAAGQSPFCSSAIAARRDLLTAIGGFPEGQCRRGGDVNTWLRALAAARCAAWSPAITATYYRDSVNMVSKQEPFAGSYDRSAVADLLQRETDPARRRMLKKFLNKRLISRYVETNLLGLPPAEKLFRFLYVAALTGKQWRVVLASLLPARWFCTLHRFSQRGK